MTPMKQIAAIAFAATLSLGLVATACSDDTQDAVDTAVDQTSALGIARAWQASLVGNETADTDPAGVRSVAVLEQSSEDLPGDPTIVGIDDADGDGADDDGTVQVDVEDQSACLTLPESGNDIDVEGGAC